MALPACPFAPQRRAVFSMPAIIWLIWPSSVSPPVLPRSLSRPELRWSRKTTGCCDRRAVNRRLAARWFFSTTVDSPVRIASSPAGCAPQSPVDRRDTVAGRITTISPGTSEWWDGFMVALTDRHRLAGQHIADTLQRFFRITLLNEADQRIDHRHGEDHRHVDPMAHHRLSNAAASRT